MTNYRELEEEFFRALYNSIENKDHLGYKDRRKTKTRGDFAVCNILSVGARD